MPLQFLFDSGKKFILLLQSNVFYLSVIAGIILVFQLTSFIKMNGGFSLILLLLFGLFFRLTVTSWLDKPSARIAIGILITVLIAVITFHLELDFYKSLTRYKTVIELLISIGLIRIVFTRTDLKSILTSTLRKIQPSQRAFVLSSLLCLLAIPLSLATVAITCALLGDIIRPRYASAVISMRAVCATMLLLPTTVASASVSASLPSLQPSDLFFKGFPLFLIAFLGCCFQSIEINNTENKPILIAKSLQIIASFWVIFGFFSLCLQLNLVEALAFAGIFLFIIDGLIFNQRELPLILTEIRQTTEQLSSEIMLLLACGFLSVLLAQNQLPALILDIFTRTSYPAISLAIILFLLPAISILGIHPLILFNIFFPLIDNSVLGNTSSQYLVWVTMFISAQLISPVSLSAIIAASNLALTPTQTSFKIHLRYALYLSCYVGIYILLIR